MGQRISKSTPTLGQSQDINWYCHLIHSCICLLILSLIYLFWPHPQHVEVPGPGIEPMPQQLPLQWQCQILNLLCHKRTPLKIFDHIKTLKTGVPVVAHQKQIWLVFTRTWVQSLASFSGLRIWCCHELWCRWVVAWIWCCCGCGVSFQLQLQFNT